MTKSSDGDPPARNEKLVVTKQKWAKDGRLLTGGEGNPKRDRLPPGQRLVKDWPTLDLGVTPKHDLEKWRLRVDGAVEKHRVVGILYGRDGLLEGERVFASERCARLMMGDLYDELSPLPDA